MNNPPETPQEKTLAYLNIFQKMFPKPTPQPPQLDPQLKPIIEAITTEIRKLNKSFEEIGKHLTTINKTLTEPTKTKGTRK